MDGHDRQQSKLFDELCALIFAFIRSPHLFFPSAQPPLQPLRSCAQRSQFTPVGLGLLLLGASLTLMLCGSVTFVLGCILMPWIIGLVIFFYFLGVISSLSDFGKAILCLWAPAPAETSPKEVKDQFF